MASVTGAAAGAAVPNGAAASSTASPVAADAVTSAARPAGRMMGESFTEEYSPVAGRQAGAGLGSPTPSAHSLGTTINVPAAQGAALEDMEPEELVMMMELVRPDLIPQGRKLMAMPPGQTRQRMIGLLWRYMVESAPLQTTSQQETSRRRLWQQQVQQLQLRRRLLRRSLSFLRR